MKRRLTFIVIFFILSNSMSWSQSVNLPLEHWAYDFLDRLQTKGTIRNLIPVSKPYSRQEVASMLAETEKQIQSGEGSLTPTEQAIFEQLKGEFHEELKSLNVPAQHRYLERHLLQWQENDNHIKTDLHFDQLVDVKTGDRYEKTESISRTTLGGIVRGRLKDNLGFFLFAKNTLTRGEDIPQENFDPSQGAPITISGKNAYSDDASAYFVWKLPWFEMELGRDRVQWGPGIRGSLMLSANNPRFDMLKLRVPFKRFRFTSIHGKLNSGTGSKFLSAHRLELRVSQWLIISGSELVIYGDRNVEPMYINPLMPYHIAEHHLGDKDNNTLGLDVVAFPRRNHKLYAELFIDDFTTAENPFTYYGNKFAFLFGWRWVSPFSLNDADLTFEYTRIEPYVYTHHDAINVYKNYDNSIGHWLEPNSDNLFIKAGFLMNRDFRVAITSERTRHGEGDIDTPYAESMGTHKRFLSGIIETRWSWGFELNVQIFRDAFLSLNYFYLNTKNADRNQDNHTKDHQMKFKLFINY